MLGGVAEAVKRYTDTRDGQSPFKTAIAGVTILRSDQKAHPSCLIFKPALCITVQGASQTTAYVAAHLAAHIQGVS